MRRPGSIKISGLRTDVDNDGTGQVKFAALRTTFVTNNGTPKPNPFGGDVVIPSVSTFDAGQNVVDYDNRLGGQDRYETAAKIYDQAFRTTPMLSSLVERTSRMRSAPTTWRLSSMVGSESLARESC